ncbi:DUF5406 domain-containing protein [Clostridium botulinum D/C]|uniref:DUF5406 family protein n=1 Tax=Clostridium botulinum TaxID=1491 RepID=UPI001E429218|nr:DUF5406 family protein [Clostridium botulinum]MCD3321630.1 DUF5406 domain-containing protein [Clostridium botulinum D/C]MCD3324905.1 DUF5406 domain-containing protein [Clostridium botulinum D/C]MCD3328156.1 DUF5406 domain-containing protein [Clostridium botulinum D/C]
MKKYDISDNFRNRIHTVRVTFQHQEFKGHIAYEVRGNCRGLGVLNIDVDYMDSDDIRRLKENDCNFTWNEEYELYQLVLQDEDGNTCEMNNIEENEISDYVVAVEIIDCKLEKE